LDERKVERRRGRGFGTPRSRLRLQVAMLVSLCAVLALFVAVHLQLDPQYDFGTFYYAAHMVLDGSGRALYNAGAQHVFQGRFHRPPDMLFRNPPYALIPILPLAELPMVAAFSIWTAFCLGLLFISLRLLQDEAKTLYGNWPMLLAIVFVPVLASFLHGQFSLVVVASYSLTYALWRRGRGVLGGMVLAIATIKFQLVIGFIGVLLLKCKVRELVGFAIGCAILLALSIWMVGIPSLRGYPEFALHANLPLPETSHLANWHGFLYIIGIDRPMVLIPISAGTVVLAALIWEDLDRGFAAAVLAAMLVSFHLTPQDLSLLLVPFYLCIKAGVLPRAHVPAFAFVSIAIPMVMVQFHDLPFAALATLLGAALWQIGSKRFARQTGTDSALADHALTSG
jgi:hypothetical protein